MDTPKSSASPERSQAGPSSENRSIAAKLKEAYLRPVTKDNILYYYIPAQGLFCYSALAINVMNPALFADTLPKRNITNTLLLGCFGGVGLYLYGRPHMRKLKRASRIGFSVFGSMMFSFGSVLTWAILRSTLSESNVACSTFGLLCAAGLAKCGILYCTAIDDQTSPQS